MPHFLQPRGWKAEPYETAGQGQLVGHRFKS